jgi:hypothetical protein
VTLVFHNGQPSHGGDRRTFEWVSDCCLTPIQQFATISWREQGNFQWDDDDARFVLDQHAELNFVSASSQKLQSTARRVAPIWLFCLIPSQPVFAFFPYCCVLSEEATNTNVIVLGLTQPGLKLTIYRTRCEHTNHYATDAVKTRLLCQSQCPPPIYIDLCINYFHWFLWLKWTNL